MVYHTEEEEWRLHCFESTLGCKIVAFDLPEFHVCDGNLTETPSFTLQQPFWIWALNGCLFFFLCQALSSRFPVPDISLCAWKGNSLWRTALHLSYWDFADPGSGDKCVVLSPIDVRNSREVSGEIPKMDFDPGPGGLVMWFTVSDTPLSWTCVLMCMLQTSPAAWTPRSTPAPLFSIFPPPTCNTHSTEVAQLLPGPTEPLNRLIIPLCE